MVEVRVEAVVLGNLTAVEEAERLRRGVRVQKGTRGFAVRLQSWASYARGSRRCCVRGGVDVRRSWVWVRAAALALPLHGTMSCERYGIQ